MTEPASSAAAGIGLFKLVGMISGATLVAIVVMVMAQPTSRREWAVALISTVIGSICGGAAAIQYLGLQQWSGTFEGSLALAGLHFSCGLPAWVIVRAWFVYAEKRRNATLPEIVRELKDSRN